MDGEDIFAGDCAKMPGLRGEGQMAAGRKTKIRVRFVILGIFVLALGGAALVVFLNRPLSLPPITLELPESEFRRVVLRNTQLSPDVKVETRDAKEIASLVAGLNQLVFEYSREVKVEVNTTMLGGSFFALFFYGKYDGTNAADSVEIWDYDFREEAMDSGQEVVLKDIREGHVYRCTVTKDDVVYPQLKELILAYDLEGKRKDSTPFTDGGQ